MKLILIVGIGSFLGGIARYILSTFVQERSAADFPFGTLAVNLAGCFIIGCLFGLAEKWQLNLQWRLLLFTGLLGGFTTFSAFSSETFQLMRTGYMSAALIYVFSSIFFGIALTFAGAWLFKFIP